MYKTLISILTFSIFCLILSCNPKNSKSNSDQLIENVEEAVKLIKEYEGDVKDFQLGVNEKLISDGFSLVIITDAMLKKGWTFNGSKDVKGGKIYFYKKMDLRR